MRALMTEAWLLASILIGTVGFAAGSPPVVIIAALIFGTGGAARLWSRLSLERVVYERTLSEHRVFAGESVDLTLAVENQKVLPVPWIEVRETFPRGMPATAQTRPGSAPGTEVLVRSTSLGSNDRVEWEVSLRAARRGYFRVGPTLLRSGDIFGFFEREQVGLPRIDGIVVYPRTYALAELGFDSARPFGEFRGGNPVFEDPARVVGVRDYQHGDPMRRIDWKATARVGRLQSRLYEPSRSLSLIVALNIPTFEYTWQGSDPVLLERGISVAASIARWAFDSGAAVGLIANGSFPDADRTIRIGAGSRPDQLNRILEALAMITAFTTSAMSTDLEDPHYPLPAGATVLVIAAVMPPDLAASLHALRADGYIVHVVKTSEQDWDAHLGTIPVTDIVPAVEALEAQAEAEGILGGTGGPEPIGVPS